jgi:hypothetical protein
MIITCRQNAAEHVVPKAPTVAVVVAGTAERHGPLTRLNAGKRAAFPAAARRCVGAWGPLAKALRYEWDSIQKVATGKRAVTPADELLAGQWLSARVCPHCGHPPDDFVDEDTRVG